MITAPVAVSDDGPIRLIALQRPEARNAVDPATASALLAAFQDFETDASARVAVLTGAGPNFCSGADLKAFAAGAEFHVSREGPGPLGPTRLELSKPLVGAIAGYAVAGGLELALMCDLRVIDETTVFGVFCRRWGVPLIDGGTWRLPRLIGLSRALDLILTGRAVAATEALAIGLAHRLAPPGETLQVAVELAHELAGLPQDCLRADRRSALGNFGAGRDEAFAREISNAAQVLAAARSGAGAFARGAGRHGKPAPSDPDPAD